MPLLNDMKIYGDQARAALMAGETLLSLSSADVAYGAQVDDPEHPWMSPVGRKLDALFDRIVPQPKSTAGKVALGAAAVAAWAAFAAPDPLPVGFPESWVGGRIFCGAQESLAGQLRTGLAIFGGRADYVAASDRRLLLLKSGRSSGRDPMTVVWAIDRSLVPAARYAPRLLSRRRVAIAFADQSWIVLATRVHLGSWHAKQLARALRGSTPPRTRP